MTPDEKEKVVAYLKKHHYKKKKFFGLSFTDRKACEIASALRVNGSGVSSYYEDGEFIDFYIQGRALKIQGL